MITSGQIKAARALLNWTVQELADRSGIGFTTVVRMEASDGIPASQVKTLDAVRKVLEKSGIEFIGSPDDAPGVRLRK